MSNLHFETNRRIFESSRRDDPEIKDTEYYSKHKFVNDKDTGKPKLEA